MRSLKASGEKELSEILDYVHDRKFDISRIDHNARLQTLTIPIALRSNRASEKRSWFLFGGGNEATTLGQLVVKRALGFKVVDDARMGEGDINTIINQGGKIFIKGSLPVEVKIEVDGLEIELILPDDAKPA